MMVATQNLLERLIRIDLLRPVVNQAPQGYMIQVNFLVHFTVEKEEGLPPNHLKYPSGILVITSKLYAA
jgi:hypothetical protein